MLDKLLRHLDIRHGADLAEREALAADLSQRSLSSLQIQVGLSGFAQNDSRDIFMFVIAIATK